MPAQTKPLQASAQKFQDFLSRKGLDFKVSELSGSTRTSQDAAIGVGCSVAQIAKSLVFKDKKSGLPILIIASGENRVDLKKIRAVTGLKLGRADADYVKKQVGYAIGGVPPAGHLTPLQTILDPDLKKHEQIWAAAGTPHALFQLAPADLELLTDGHWIVLAE